MTKSEQAAQMRDREGASIDAIMLHFGWSRKTAWDMIGRGRRYQEFRTLQNEGNRARRSTCEAAKRREARAAAKRDRDAAIAEFVRSGWLIVEAARRFGLSPSSVTAACHAHGVKPSEVQLCVDRRLSIIANAQRRAWADPERRASRIDSLRLAKSGDFQNSKA